MTTPVASLGGEPEVEVLPGQPQVRQRFFCFAQAGRFPANGLHEVDCLLTHGMDMRQIWDESFRRLSLPRVSVNGDPAGPIHRYRRG